MIAVAAIILPQTQKKGGHVAYLPAYVTLDTSPRGKCRLSARAIEGAAGRCATVEVPAAVCGAQSASSSRGKFGPFAQVSRPALFASESSVSNSRPGLRHSVASTYKAMDHKQGDGKSTRGANPTRSCEDREHGPIPRRRCRRRVGTVRADGGLTRADVPGNIDATELWTSVHVEAPRIDSSYSWCSLRIDGILAIVRCRDFERAADTRIARSRSTRPRQSRRRVISLGHAHRHHRHE